MSIRLPNDFHGMSLMEYIVCGFGTGFNPRFIMSSIAPVHPKISEITSKITRGPETVQRAFQQLAIIFVKRGTKLFHSWKGNYTQFGHISQTCLLLVHMS